MLGWSDEWDRRFAQFAEQGLEPARVVAEHKGAYRLAGLRPAQGDRSDLWGEISGRFRHAARSRAEYPAVGDWVAVRPLPGEDRAMIVAVLPRKSKFSRKVAGDGADEQVVSANVDTVLLMMGLDQDFSPRRLERYLVMAWESGARPAIVLNKADLCDDVAARVQEVEAVTRGVPTHVVSCRTGLGLAELNRYVEPGQTVALLGSSGVGKSTLINRLYGADVMRTGDVRERDHRGRHTTVHRQLIRLPGGGLLIDNPGMRELQLWDADEGLRSIFEDVESLARACRFGDCQHEAEPDCAVLEAVAEGRLSPERLESYRTMQRELAQLAARLDRLAHQESRRRVKVATRAFNSHQPRR